MVLRLITELGHHADYPFTWRRRIRIDRASRRSLSANERGIYYSLSTLVADRAAGRPAASDEDVAPRAPPPAPRAPHAPRGPARPAAHNLLRTLDAEPRSALCALSPVIAAPTLSTFKRPPPHDQRWLGRGSMFVLSSAQATRLLPSAPSGPLVDVGAGDGEVSRRFAHLYEEKYATEISACMRKVLVGKGYTILDTSTWWQSHRFGCVAMLNLLDRCSEPRAMLRQARAALDPAGVLLLALVLPYKPYVEVTPNHKPNELLPIEGSTFEEQVVSFVQFMETLGFELSSWTRAPYLCEGDFAQAYYWLDDSVYVFRTKPIPSDT
ncbi:unnamed protein product [Plutella xylostella]|uniref:(diamondback moth) hypothetical protein n=1 Tax=Plutella xylostella TaxID=51655 RepID=A0A8S4CVR2_PLUXY|nr:unnamed protein product [Plutella xylostella]